MDLILMRFKVFEKQESSAEYMVWLLSNTLNSRFHMNDDLQFDLMTQVVKIFLEHQSNDNLNELIWAMRFFLDRESRVLERAQLIGKLNLVNILNKFIRQKLGNDGCPSWLAGALEALKLYYLKAGTSLCDPEFVAVSLS